MDKLEQLTVIVANFRKDRPVLNTNDSLSTLPNFLIEESQEVKEAATNYLATPSLEAQKELAQECADVLVYLLSLCLFADIDLFSETIEKMAYNNARYTSHAFSNGDSYQEAVKKCREFITKIKFKQDFYKIP